MTRQNVKNVRRKALNIDVPDKRLIAEGLKRGQKNKVTSDTEVGGAREGDATDRSGWRPLMCCGEPSRKKSISYCIDVSPTQHLMQACPQSP